MAKIKDYSVDDLEQHFLNEIENVVYIYKFKLDFGVKEYLSKLMFRTVFHPIDLNDTLTEIYSSTIEKDKQKKISIYTKLGDKALILSGHFPDFVKRKSSLEFYSYMGKKGYTNRYFLDKKKIFYNLSLKFDDLVRVLNEVSESRKKYTTEEICDLYDKWFSTKDPNIGRRLNSKGFLTKGILE